MVFNTCWVNKPKCIIVSLNIRNPGRDFYEIKLVLHFQLGTRDKLSYVCLCNNKDADQPAHLHGLIIAFVFGCLDSIIPILADSTISKL